MFEDQNPKSKFKDYIKTLTQQTPALFCDWPNEILDEVQDPQLLDSTLEMQADIDVNLEAMQAFIKKNELELLKLATVSKNYIRQWYARVTTRIFGWYLPFSFMCPLFDMMNHNHTNDS
jgi:hypothetical protein